MSGKGSGRRPREVSTETFQSNWEAIFGKTKKEVESEESGCSTTAGNEDGVPVGE